MNKIIKTVLIATLLLGTTSVFAKGKKFEQRKTIIIEHITKKIEFLNTFKSCASASKDGKALKICRQNLKASIKSLRTTTKAKRDALKNK